MRVLIADDHRLVRDGLRALLEREGFEVVGEACSGREVVPAWERTRPDVLLVDVLMPELDGIDATRQLLEVSPKAKVIGLSMNGDRRSVLAMFAAGACGYLLKSSTPAELRRALHEVSEGRHYVSPFIATALPDWSAETTQESGTRRSSAPPGVSAARSLTLREREVLRLVAEGASSRQIAAKLDVAVATVETHRRQIMDKLGLRTVAELTKYAIRQGLTSV